MSCCNFLLCACGSFVPQQRSIYAVLMLLSVMLMSMQRYSLPTSMYEIAPSAYTKSRLKLLCPNNTLEKSNIVIKEAQMDWKWEERRYILLCFYVSYLIFGVPLGICCDRYGSRLFIMSAMFCSSIITGLTPAIILVFSSWHGIAFWQVLLGASHSVIVPGMTTLLAKWIPVHERGLYASVSFSAEVAGELIGIQLASFLQRITHMWSVDFYLLGGIGVLWSGICGLYVYSSPFEHPRLPAQERNYLKAKIGIARYHKFPIISILTDLSVIGQGVAMFGNKYFMGVYIERFPTYAHQVLNCNYRADTLIRCTGFMGCTILCGKIADMLSIDFKIAYMRSCFTQLGTFIPCGVLMIASHMNCDKDMVVYYMMCALVSKGAYYAGAGINVLDTTLVYSGGVKGIIMMFGVLGELVSIRCWDALIVNMSTFDTYHVNFSHICIVCVCTSLFFATFVRGERATWDYHPEDDVPEKPERNYCVRSFACYNSH